MLYMVTEPGDPVVGLVTHHVGDAIHSDWAWRPSGGVSQQTTDTSEGDDTSGIFICRDSDDLAEVHSLENCNDTRSDNNDRLHTHKSIAY